MTGYIYCFSNPIYPDYLYVGASTKKPNERADELYTEGLLTPFKIELAKQVSSLDGKLVILHKLLSKMGERVNPNRDYFSIDKGSIENLFDLIDGTPWVATTPTEISEASWLSLVEKVKVLVKQDNPKANEFQLNQLKMKVAGSLKGRFGEGVEPTLEMIREAVNGGPTVTPI
jgi:hypothetical protein